MPIKRPRFGYEIRPNSCTLETQTYRKYTHFVCKNSVLARGFLFIQLYKFTKVCIFTWFLCAQTVTFGFFCFKSMHFHVFFVCTNCLRACLRKLVCRFVCIIACACTNALVSYEDYACLHVFTIKRILAQFICDPNYDKRGPPRVWQIYSISPA